MLFRYFNLSDRIISVRNCTCKKFEIHTLISDSKLLQYRLARLVRLPRGRIILYYVGLLYEDA